MYRPVRLQAKNFLSFKEVDYEFQTGATLIQGINLTDEGAKSNGSGKSSLQEMIYFAYIGDASRSIPMKKLIRRGEESADVELILSNGQTGLAIKRSVNLKGSSTLEILENNLNGIKQISFASVADGNKLLRETIGITIDDFKNFFLVNRGNYKSFFRLSDNDKKEFIGRFSGAEKLKKVYPIIEAGIKGLENECANFMQKKSILDVKIESIKSTIHQLELSKQERHSDNRIGELGIEIRTCEQQIVELQNKIQELNKISYDVQRRHFLEKASIFSNQVSRLENISFDNEIEGLRKFLKERDEDVSNSRRRIEDLSKEKLLILKAIQEIDNLITNSIQCPKCNHKFSLQDENYDEDNILNERQELIGALDELSRTLDTDTCELEYLNDMVRQIQKDISSFSTKETKRIRLIRQATKDRNDCNDKLLALYQAEETNKRKIDGFLFDIECVEKQIEEKKAEIENLENNSHSAQFDKMISEREDELNGLLNEVSNLNKYWRTYNASLIRKRMWLNNFKKFYSYLTNHSLQILQDRTNIFLGQMKTSLRIQIEGFKQLQNGDIREQISVGVLRDGVFEGLVSEFSAGEQARLEIAMALSCQSIINESCDNGLDIFFADEVADSVDSEGLKGIIKALSNLNKTIMIVSHIYIDEMLDNDVVTVVKENGISKII